MVIVDTGFRLALANRNDSYHTQARTVLANVNEPLITTWAVVTETCYLLLIKMGNHAQVSFINNLFLGAFTVFDLQPHHGKRICELMEKYANLPMDLGDASLVVLAEHLGDGRILSIDFRDFNAYRWKNKYPFENLMVC
ncbi:PIN domain-containing protein [Nostoc sp. FACHB-888]|uniref:type II toxin-antitoxin system VapC family toxin n=1 Tax=Nostoc sp. FACHB-888 TaxID=2692842 RepID=UPI001687B70A|nr:PIN domain-containing protein [Nostoc sp. FACHB-888]MBD2244704.1 PIN domain-containing protein [Nostoc sp. FACHB-888]